MQDLNDSKVFAIKSVDRQAIETNADLNVKTMFDTECQIMGKFDHPNILKLYERLQTSNNYYLVMKYCNRGDLHYHVMKSQGLAEQDAVYFLKQIMNGFKELHKHKIMHRDVKLENIF